MSSVVITPGTVDTDATVEFTVAITNDGDAPLTWAHIHMPGDFIYTGNNILSPWTTADNPDGVTASGGEIAPGDTGLFLVSATTPGAAVENAQWNVEVSETDETGQFTITGSDTTDVVEADPVLPDKPNVEEIAIAWLPTITGSTWKVCGDMPNPRPDKFILVDRTGGPRESMVLDRAELLIEVYAKNSRPTASNMALYIADNINGLLEYESITRAVVNSVVNLGDTIGQFQRYQVYCDVWCRR